MAKGHGNSLIYAASMSECMATESGEYDRLAVD